MASWNEPSWQPQIGDCVVRNPATWQPSEFDGWLAGDGIGRVVEPPPGWDRGDGTFLGGGVSDADCVPCVDVMWPSGRCSQRCDELFLATPDHVIAAHDPGPVPPGANPSYRRRRDRDGSLRDCCRFGTPGEPCYGTVRPIGSRDQDAENRSLIVAELESRRLVCEGHIESVYWGDPYVPEDDPIEDES